MSCEVCDGYPKDWKCPSCGPGGVDELVNAITTLLEDLRKDGNFADFYQRTSKVRDVLSNSWPCVGCGTRENVEYTEDPYQKDVNQVSMPTWLCSKCYQQYCDDT